MTWARAAARSEGFGYRRQLDRNRNPDDHRTREPNSFAIRPLGVALPRGSCEDFCNLARSDPGWRFQNLPQEGEVLAVVVQSRTVENRHHSLLISRAVRIRRSVRS